jgi:hypothetical protein
VLRPQKGEPTRAGFFFRPESGPIRTDSTYRIFVARESRMETTFADLAEAVSHSSGPSSRPLFERAGPAPAAAPPVPAGEKAPPSEEPAEEVIEPPPELFWQAPESSTRRWVLPAVLLLVLGGVGFGAYTYRDFLLALLAPPIEQSIDLRLVDENGQLTARWNPESLVVRSALHGTVELGMGLQRIRLPLSAAELKSGRLPVLRHGADVEIRMAVDTPTPNGGQNSRLYVARFFGRPPAPAAAPAAGAAPQELFHLRNEIVRLQGELDAQVAANGVLETGIRRIREVERAKALTPQAPPASVPVNEPAVESKPPAAQQPTVSETPPPQPAPAPPPQPAPVAASPAPAPPAYAGPRSGRIIWTGFLAPNSSVTVDGRRASIGTVNNALPGVPVRLRVQPAGFTSEGISVYSANTRFQSGNVKEGRSARNGWMNTQYVYDPAKAGNVSLALAPSGQGGYRQFMIRTGGQPVAAVVIDWEVVE